MGLSWAYASALEGTSAEKEALLQAALDRGVTLFNSANIYTGPQGSNEELLGRAFAGRDRASFLIATKFGVALPAFVPNLAAASIAGHCEAALQRCAHAVSCVKHARCHAQTQHDVRTHDTCTRCHHRKR
jgi:aryl-alcohol dehydrogenase-like predicted oxidoreductase